MRKSVSINQSIRKQTIFSVKQFFKSLSLIPASIKEINIYFMNFLNIFLNENHGMKALWVLMLNQKTSEQYSRLSIFFLITHSPPAIT